MTLRPVRGLKGLLAATVLLFPLLTQSPALAANQVTPAKTQLEDSGSGWKLMVTIKLDKKPLLPHQTYRFLFKPVVIYETFLDDSRPGEQTRKLPQDKNIEPLIESLDVGFADASGTVWQTTKFDFTIRRARGFEAGEYRVEVRDSDNRAVGQPFNLTLNGKNEVIDRRAMIFTGEKKKKEAPVEKPEEKKEDAPPAAVASSETPAETEPKPEEAPAPPPAAQPKQGGCGCEIPSGAPSGEALGAVMVAAAVAVSRRKRR